MKNINEMTDAELEKALEARKKAKEAQRKKEKEAYESQRDSMIISLVDKAQELSKELSKFKGVVFQEIEAFQELANKYGDIRSNSKGGFSLRTNNGEFKVSYFRNIINNFDERADKALALIKEFLESTVKKRDLQSYKIISTLLVRNKAGDLNVSRVIQLLDLRHEFTDKRWTEAIRLLEESYRDRPIAYNISFFQRNETTGKDELIPLNFSAINVDAKKKQDENKS